MSKLLVNLALLQTKALVNAFTWTTLPLYVIAQRPWRRLKLSKSFGVVATKDQYGRVVYSRPSPLNIEHPYLNCYSFSEILPHLDRNKKIAGVRDVISEVPQLDPQGNPIKIDGRELTKVKLGDYKWFTIGNILDRADAMGRGLQAMGVKAGDKVILYSDNCLEYLCMCFALQKINATTVTLLSILNDEGIVYGINQCEAKFMVVSQSLLKKIDKMSDSINNPLTVVYIPDKFATNGEKLKQRIANLTTKKQFKIITLDQLEELGAKQEPLPFPRINRKELSLIMYTSGTTGNPKGVMLTHEQLTACMKNILRFDKELDTSMIDSPYVAYLPMAHLYGYLLNMGLFTMPRAKIGLCSPLTLLDSSPAHVPGQVGDIKLIRPLFIPAVPLVLDRIIKEIYRKLEARSPLAAPLFTYLMDYKIKWRSRGFDTPIINRIVCRKINEQFGGKFKVMLIGSAPLSERTQALGQAALNIKMIQAYGATELAGATHAMVNDDLNYGECGVPFHSVRYYLKDWADGDYYTTDKPNPRGEIVVGGDVVAEGYYKMPEETAESFKTDPDGTRWFETGDVGEVLPNGTLKIIDRKKDLTKLANGEFVSLGKIESGLRSSPFVENLCVCSNPYANHVTALISPNRKSLAELGEKLSKKGFSFEQLCQDPDVVSHITDHLRQLGNELKFQRIEIPKMITLVTEEWNPDSNLLTAALKVKRKQVNDFYRDEIARMFATTGDK